jgi:hypothetical protein
MKLVNAARRVVRRNPHRKVGTISFPTLGGTYGEWESVLERDAYMTIAYCRDVIGIDTQPITLEFENPNGGTFYYTPDSRIHLLDGRERLLEVKPAVFALRDDEFERLCLIKRQCLCNGDDFGLLTDTEIRVITRLKNVQLARTYTNASDVHTPAKVARELLSEHGAMTISHLAEISRLRLSRQNIFVLIAYRELSINWNEPLTIHSTVSLPNTAFEELTYAGLLANAEANRLLGEFALGNRKEDQRLLALAKAHRRPVLPPVTWGFG